MTLVGNEFCWVPTSFTDQLFSLTLPTLPTSFQPLASTLKGNGGRGSIKRIRFNRTMRTPKPDRTSSLPTVTDQTPKRGVPITPQQMGFVERDIDREVSDLCNAINSTISERAVGSGWSCPVPHGWEENKRAAVITVSLYLRVGWRLSQYWPGNPTQPSFLGLDLMDPDAWKRVRNPKL